MEPPSEMPRRKLAKPYPPVPGAAGLSVNADAEIGRAARGRRLKDRELFEAQLGADLERMAAFHPREIVGNDEAVLFFDRGQKARSCQVPARSRR